MTPEWLLPANIIAKRLSPIAITSVKTWTASLTSEMLPLNMPPTTSMAAIAAVIARDRVSSLFGCLRPRLVANVGDSRLPYLRLVFACAYLGKRDLRRVLVLYHLRSPFLWIDSINERGLSHRRVLQSDHDYLVVV